MTSPSTRAGHLTCPADVTRPMSKKTGTVSFGAACTGCPLRERCTTAKDGRSRSVIAVQSAVGRHVMDTQPEEARQALAAIESTSRSALTEMRRLLGVLRQDGEPTGSLAPEPGLADLAPLMAQVGEARLKVWVQVNRESGPVPPGVDLSAYRIIQEALTNVIKHAAASFTITLTL